MKTLKTKDEAWVHVHCKTTTQAWYQTSLLYTRKFCIMFMPLFLLFSYMWQKRIRAVTLPERGLILQVRFLWHVFNERLRSVSSFCLQGAPKPPATLETIYSGQSFFFF